jgi:succinate-semialdehyde dehydrogenase/glutarate-semialdehyde dehydrogenase
VEPCEADLIEKTPRLLYVGGSWREGGSAESFPVHDPSTNKILTSVADATVEDAGLALDAAVAAFPSWAAVAPRKRSEILLRCFETLMAESEEFALLITLEMGKPLVESRSEVAYAAEFFRWFAEEATRIQGRYSKAPGGSGQIVVKHEPVGPVLAITPWNFPLAMGTRKIAPALAAGCTIIVKPAEETPLTMLRLADLMQRCGVPSGVLNVIPTSRPAEICDSLTSDSRLRKLTFTGSTNVGRLLIKSSANHLLRMSMELGGNAPFIVFADCDLDAAVKGAIQAKMRNNGEACTAANRFYVQKPLLQQFSSHLADRLSSMKMGRGTVEGVEVGPLINKGQWETTNNLVQDALEQGARVIGKAATVPTEGWFYPATVLVDIPLGARILREEVFGPVAAIRSFESEEEVIAAANDTEYGLASYIWTRDLDRTWRVASALETGMVGVNRGIISDPAAPFGGVKASGFGREGGTEGIHEYLEAKYIAFQ